MISSQKITTSEVRKYNKNRIFKLIYNSSAISRQEIADQPEYQAFKRFRAYSYGG